MESVCDKPQAARTRGPKIRVVGAIRVDNHKQVVVNVEVKPSRLYLIAFLGGVSKVQQHALKGQKLIAQGNALGNNK